jgi:hypothetical protein
LEFAQEIYAAIDRAVQFPKAWSQMSENTRRCLVNRFPFGVMNRFPFGVIYRIRPGYIEVVAVADLRRHPDYWLDR